MEEGRSDFDVIVIGGGIMGSSTAYQTSKRGHNTLLLERFDFLHHLGSSHGESRTLRSTYPEPYYSSLVSQSHLLWRLSESEAGYSVYTQTPHLDIGPADSSSLRAVLSSCLSNSLPHQVLDPDALHRKFSGRIGLPEGWIAVCTEMGGVIKPTKAVSMFLSLASARGAVLRDKTEVKGIRRDEKGGVIVCCDKGEEFRGRKCVITAGAWMRKLVESMVGVCLPIQPLETTVWYWRIEEGHEEGYSIEGGFPTFASYGEPYIYGTPSLEFPGMMKIAVHGGHPCYPDRRSWKPSSGLNSLKEWIRGRFRGNLQDTEPAFVQSCMYSMTPDEDFILDFLGGEFGEDVVLGGGFSGHGFKMAPVVGRILADLALTGTADGVELQHFRLARFNADPKGNIKEHEDQVGRSLGQQ
ncbi:hypothetical protein MLD38_014015 [Melastoma candidum]|uniref:Uncharacterized protein n=1 Tax=Melastoma candidum TaxID=119954 RepID=A0ACB9RBC7_9MYRT|nr:hypothetical protein MLD38_014015 [Melastoma candidum]